MTLSERIEELRTQVDIAMGRLAAPVRPSEWQTDLPMSQLELIVDRAAQAIEQLDDAKKLVREVMDAAENAKADAMQRIADDHLRSVAPRLLEALEQIVEDAVRYEDTADSRLMRIATDAIALARDVPALTKRADETNQESATPAAPDCPVPMVVGGKYRFPSGSIWTLISKYDQSTRCWSYGDETIHGDGQTWADEVRIFGLALIEEPAAANG